MQQVQPFSASFYTLGAATSNPKPYPPQRKHGHGELGECRPLHNEHRESVAVACMPISAPGRVEQSQRATWQEMCSKCGQGSVSRARAGAGGGEGEESAAQVGW